MLNPEIELFQADLDSGRHESNLIGEDPYFTTIKQKIRRIAVSDRTVLITGETGTGKEMCARALHRLSPRGHKPWVPINCGAVPCELFERELFGHHQGAFTGASSTQPGFLAAAEGGTLFLDEVDAFPLVAQIKLLRFLQDQTYWVLGSPKMKKADVRVIACTNVNLNRKIREGTFREDLFYRLAVLSLNLPSLRERRGDIPLLAQYFLAKYGDNRTANRMTFSFGALRALQDYAWPGNVRELENVVHQILVLSDLETIEAKDLPITTAAHDFEKISFKQAKAFVIEQFERNYIASLLQKHNGNVTRAAQEAQKDRRALGRLIKKYSLPKSGLDMSNRRDRKVPPPSY